ncbi:hypothetical protein EG68_02100 [Paragonimus skrjabini miyazakii]|uniref:Rhodanese domain-containing protein n=1 Tax=Paragonimus skrjabini miyazakii TaxID=59628 RepID=A0A8S9Z6K1_9TREM|nr:hypothetical protein EG68_02100 [Paragonimus skrjabini miyazakii]
MNISDESSDWPTTPITKCRKRPKLDTPLADSSTVHLNLNNGENLESDVRFSTQDDRRILGSVENVMSHNRIRSSREQITSPCKLMKRPASVADASSIDHHGYWPNATSSPLMMNTSKKHSRRCHSGGDLCPFWPMVEVEQLARMLRTAVSITDSKDQLTGQNLSSNHESDLKPSPTMDMVYVSSSSSSCSSSACTACASDEENKTPHNSRRNSSCRRYVGLRLPQKSLFVKNDQFHKVDQYKSRGRRLIIVDCRYPYEFRGGHIQGAVNLAEWPKLCHFLFSSCCNARSTTKNRNPNYDDAIQQKSHVALDVPTNKPHASRTTFVLHCEFSSHRAPTLFTLLRNHDRLLHLTCYPALRYPKVYILRGGYSAFYRHYPELCVPSGYMKMYSRPDLLPIWKRYCHMVNRKQTESSASLAEFNFMQVNPHWTSPTLCRKEQIPHQGLCSECNRSYTARKNIWQKINFS